MKLLEIKNKSIGLLIALAIFLFLAGCKSDDNGGVMPPVLAVLDLTQSVPENQEITTVIAQFDITQENLTAPLVFELTEISRSGAVTVNDQGQLIVADATAFDFERLETISGQVQASSDDIVQTASFTLNITDEVEDAVPFITRWNLTTGNLTIQLPLYEGTIEDPTEYDFQVDWGDGSPIDFVTSFDDPDARHAYSTIGGTRTVTITGILEGFSFGENIESRLQFIDVAQWGDMRLGNTGRNFFNCTNLIGFTAEDTPILKEVTNMSSMFERAISFNSNISNWNVSNVSNMLSMFRSAEQFNQNLSRWNTGNVTQMESMFQDAASFNRDISNWDVSNVSNMFLMFRGAEQFNQDLSRWNTGNVTQMESMFQDATSFNQDISNWDVSSVTTMAFMFASASVFNGNLSTWDVSNVRDMFAMFSNTGVFNQDLSNWDVSNVTFMDQMFNGALVFNGNLSTWDVSNVTKMDGMFVGASAFTGDISDWDVSSVSNMSAMFGGAESFNEDLSSWDVSSVTNMRSMFLDAVSFSQDLSNWATDNVTECENFANGSALTAEQLPTRGPCF